MSSRVDSDTARCIVIFWCLLAFIACGFEHSVANMTLLSLGVIAHGFESGAVIAALYNLVIVTAGNFVGGAVMVGGLYWLAGSAGLERTSKVTVAARTEA
jgi:nitrite transporter NirC